MVQGTFHIGNNQAAYIERASESWGVSKSEVVRRALDPYMQTHPVDEPVSEAVEADTDPVAPVESETGNAGDETPHGRDGETDAKSWWERNLW